MATLNGTTGNDYILDTAFDDYIDANDGNDEVRISTGKDTAYGGAGNDTLYIDWSSASADSDFDGSYGQAFVDGGDGTFSGSSRRVGFSSFEHLHILAGSGNDRLEGIGNSTDTLNGGSGIDLWQDYFTTFASALTVNMAAISTSGGVALADGSVIGNMERVSLTMGAGNDLFRDYGNYSDWVDGYTGNDDLGTSGGRDTMYGGSGSDTLTIDWANATEDTDVDGSYGQAFVDDTDGTWAGSTRRVGFSSFEHLDVTTGDGDDRLEGVANSSDTLDGGVGKDQWDDSFVGLITAINVDMSQISGAGQTLSDGSQLSNLERVSIIMTQGDDTFSDHGPHNDYVDGYTGNDWLATSGGRDTMYGSSGNDTLVINWSDATDNADVDGSYGQAFVDDTDGTWAGSTRRVGFSSFEHLDVTSGAGDDRLEGVANSTDTLDGGAGDDRWDDTFSGLTTAINVNMGLISGAGQTLSDGSQLSHLETAMITMTQGNDTFSDESAYSDYVDGYTGNDRLATSGGRDTMYGSAGNDTLVIDWSDAVDNADVDGSYGQAFVDDTDGTWAGSTRRVGFSSMEHLDVTTGAGDDRLEGRINATDTLDGGAGSDLWQDSFGYLSTAFNVDMALVSSATGQTLADGTVLRNLEAASVTFGTGADVFRDAGAYDDSILSNDGNDDLGTSGGRDYLNGGAGDDTLTINWANATDNADVDGSYGQAFVDDTDGTWSGSTRRVGFISMEHLDVSAGSGNDRLEGRGSDDTLRGNAGDDTLLGSGGNDVLAAGDGNDLNIDTIGNDTFYGGAGNDTLTQGIGAGVDRFYMGADNDVMQVREASEGGDRFDGGTGVDLIDFSYFTFTAANNVLIDLNAGSYSHATGGSDLLVGIEQVTGSQGVETIRGSANNDTLAGNSGNDTLYGGLGNDQLQGDNGDDLIYGEGGNDTLQAGLGLDTLNGGAGNDAIFGGDNDNLLVGDIGNDTLFGYAGNDTAYGGDGFDNMNGGGGDDDLRGGNQADTIDGSYGNDNLLGQDGNDVINGGAGNDTLNGGLNNDQLFGDAGFDSLVGYNGADTLDGGTQGDTLLGGQGNDSLIGDSGADSLNGGGDNDTMDGGADNDTMEGGSGLDLMDGGSGDDIMFGNGGTDTMLGGIGNDSIEASYGFDSLEGGDGNDSLYGQQQSDTLDGGFGDDLLVGDVGNDLLMGGSDDDTLDGGLHNDTLDGGSGNDSLNGGSGADLLIGADGDDTITGGAGADAFMFIEFSQADVITDFDDALDSLLLQEFLWVGSLTAQQVVDTFATVIAGNTVFDFGGGNILTLNNISNEQILVDNITII